MNNYQWWKWKSSYSIKCSLKKFFQVSLSEKRCKIKSIKIQSIKLHLKNKTNSKASWIEQEFSLFLSENWVVWGKKNSEIMDLPSRGQGMSTVLLLLQSLRLFVPFLKLYNEKDNPHLRLHLVTENLLIWKSCFSQKNVSNDLNADISGACECLINTLT